jgi:hypothetical protein
MVAAPQRVVQPVGIVQSVRTRVVNDAGGSKRSTNIGWVQQVASQAVNQTGAVVPAAVTGSPQANWSDYADASAHNDYSAQPSAWETASPAPIRAHRTPGSARFAPRLSTAATPACAGGHLYRYPSNQWVQVAAVRLRMT